MNDLVVTKSKLPEIKKGLLTGLEVSAGAKSSSTYYHKKEDQIKAVKNSVKNLYDISKELPLVVACQKGSTGFYIQEVILNELKQTSTGGALNIVNPLDWYDERLSDTILLKALSILDKEHGITYVLRLFDSFRTHSINNARARRIALTFILRHPNLEFISVKYKSKLKSILKHLYGVKMTSILNSILIDYSRDTSITRDEKSFNILQNNFLKYVNDLENISKIAKCVLFVFSNLHADAYSKEDFPVISEFFNLKADITLLEKVPEEVALGLISNKVHPQYDEYWSTKEKRKETKAMLRQKAKSTTDNVILRQTKSNAELGVSKKADLKKVTDFLALYKTGFETGFTEELNDEIERLAIKNKAANFPYSNIGIVIDDSESMKGHSSESKNTPRAIADFTAKVLSASANTGLTVKNDTKTTDLATSFINLIKTNSNFDAIFIISDGYENYYDGLLNEVVKAWRDLSSNMIPIYHISPITGAEVNAKVRSLGNEISSIAISQPKALITQLNAKLLEQDTRKWLEKELKTLSNS
jgi:hypothetical protein